MTVPRGGEAPGLRAGPYRVVVDTRRLLAGLDPQQLEAVTTAASPLAVIAAAGSGKTTVLTRRIAHRIATGDAAASHVLALTFTRDAAAELKRRLRRLEIGERIEAGTFHATALRLLRDRALARNSAAPHVATDRLRIVRESITQLRLSTAPGGALTDIDWARARMVDPDDYEGACRLARRRSNVPASRFADLVRTYDQVKRARGVVDFDDLLHGLLAAMHSDRQWADAVRWRHRHLFVDEAQDLNPLQHAVLEALRGGRSDLCLVGDPRQAIYGWNGADPSTLAEVELRYPGVTVVRLTTNYRCTPQVVAAASAVLAANGQADDSCSDRPDGPAVEVTAHRDEQAEASDVAHHVRRLLLQRSGNDIAVLARTNEQVDLLQRALSTLGIATRRAAGRTPLEVALAEAHRCISREQLAVWVETALLEGDETARRVAQEADRYLVTGEPGTFRAWLEARSPFDDLEHDDVDDGVSVLTFHAAKGREWWAVVVTGAEDGLVPHASAVSHAQLAEEARLFYVAVTRAAERLLVSRSERRGGRVAEPSRWLEALVRSTVADRPIPPPERVPAAADPMAPLRAWRAAIARASGVPEAAVCNDRILRSLAEHPPADVDELAERLGVTPTAARRLRPLPTLGSVGEVDDHRGVIAR